IFGSAAFLLSFSRCL
ncbi:hypothetical protein TYRP_000559, partial [Tyrophagus putrescentiae]